MSQEVAVARRFGLKRSHVERPGGKACGSPVQARTFRAPPRRRRRESSFRTSRDDERHPRCSAVDRRCSSGRRSTEVQYCRHEAGRWRRRGRRPRTIMRQLRLDGAPDRLPHLFDRDTACRRSMPRSNRRLACRHGRRRSAPFGRVVLRHQPVEVAAVGCLEARSSTCPHCHCLLQLPSPRGGWSASRRSRSSAGSG